MSVKKKLNSKSATTQKRNRRRMITFWRVIRYGTDSFVRNSWLSVAATAVMTITLLIIFSTFLMQNILNDTVSELRNKVDMTIYIKPDTSDKIGSDLTAEVKKLSSVSSVTYINATQIRAQDASKHNSDIDYLQGITEATPKYQAELNVVVKDINDTSQLQKLVDTNALIKKYISTEAGFKPSFAGERRSVIQSIGRVVNFAQIVGIIAGSVFVVISSLIIFNTIRMAIFNRKEEIQMMKLIGAGPSFIRGPFLVEAIIYGCIAALVATGLGVWGLYATSKTLLSYQISTQPTINLVTGYVVLVVIGMVAIGAVIGVISSTLATRRYLKL